MDCTLAALIACFNLSGIYLDSGLSVQDYEPAYLKRWDFISYNGDGVEETGWREEVSRSSRNPYGKIAVGYELDLRSVRIALEAVHQSSIATNSDKGINSLALSVRWFPFR